MTSKWTLVKYGCRENPGIFDTGNGAIRSIEESPAYPGIERVTVSSYCGRDYDNGRWYRPTKTEQSFATIAEARKAAR